MPISATGRHRIRCHRSATYSYANPVHNAIVARNLLASKIIGSPHKFESHRLGLEKSEDMVTVGVVTMARERAIWERSAKRKHLPECIAEIR